MYIVSMGVGFLKQPLDMKHLKFPIVVIVGLWLKPSGDYRAYKNMNVPLKDNDGEIFSLHVSVFFFCFSSLCFFKVLSVCVCLWSMASFAVFFCVSSQIQDRWEHNRKIERQGGKEIGQTDNINIIKYILTITEKSVFY